MSDAIATTEKQELGLMLNNNISMFLDTGRFEFAQRVAGMFAKSSMVPAHFQNNVGNCMIALNLAERMRVDPFMLMQNLYIVHGRPGIEAKLAIALINGAGRFEPLEFEFGETKEEGKRCRAFAKEIRTGKILYGPWVSWAMAKAERWVDKDGSKWKTMPDLMFMYRSAMFFARVYDPGVLLGLRTKDELDDMVIDVTPQPPARTLTPADGEANPDAYEIKNPDPVQTADRPHRGRQVGSKNKTKPHDPPAPPEPPQDGPKATNEEEATPPPHTETEPPKPPAEGWIPCPNNDGRKKPTKVCAVCTDRERCDPYREWRHDND